MDNKFEKIKDLIRRTGDKVVVFEGDTEFVITTLDDYTRLLEGGDRIGKLSEADMLDKINRDIAAWRASQSVLEAKLDLDEPKIPSYQRINDLTAQDELDILSEEEPEVFNPDTEKKQEEIINWSDEPLEEPDEVNFDQEEFKQELKNEDIEWDNAFNFEDIKEKQGGQPKEGLFNEKRVQNNSYNGDTQEKILNPNRQSIKKTSTKTKINKKINNFGYQDPVENNYSPMLDKNNNNTDNSFNVPPPPNINKE